MINLNIRELSNMKEWIIKNKKWLVVAIFLFLFLGIAEGVFYHDALVIDSKIYELLTKDTHDALTTFFKFITNFGGATYLIIITISFLLLKNKKIFVCIASNLALSFGTNQLLKLIFSRARPSGIQLVVETGYSFPSGHAMVSTAFYGLLIYFIFKSNWKKSYKNVCIFFLSLLIFFIGMSRIYLGVHYASDIIAGFSIGIVYLSIFVSILSKLKRGMV